MHNNTVYRVLSAFVQTFLRITPIAFRVLRTGLCVITAELAAITALAWREALVDPLRAEAYYGPMTEYIMMALVITVAGAMLFDIIGRRNASE